jgi:hypothetical protein
VVFRHIRIFGGGFVVWRWFNRRDTVRWNVFYLNLFDYIVSNH